MVKTGLQHVDDSSEDPAGHRSAAALWVKVGICGAFTSGGSGAEEPPFGGSQSAPPLFSKFFYSSAVCKILSPGEGAEPLHLHSLGGAQSFLSSCFSADLPSKEAGLEMGRTMTILGVGGPGSNVPTAAARMSVPQSQ